MIKIRTKHLERILGIEAAIAAAYTIIIYIVF